MSREVLYHEIIPRAADQAIRRHAETLAASYAVATKRELVGRVYQRVLRVEGLRLTVSVIVVVPRRPSKHSDPVKKLQAIDPKWFRELRLYKGLSQTEAAARLGVSFATVNRWENGRFTIPSDMYDRLCATPSKVVHDIPLTPFENGL